MRRTSTLALAIACAVVAAGCGAVGDEGRNPDGSRATEVSSPAASPGDTSSPGDVVRLDAPLNGAHVRIEVHPVRSDGRHGVVRYDITATPEDPTEDVRFAGLGLHLGGPGQPTTDGRGVRLFDPQTRVVHHIASTVDEEPATTLEETTTDDDGATVRGSGTAVFTAPEGDTVDLLFPHLGAAPGVPVVDTGDAVSEATGEFGEVEPGNTWKVRAFTQAYGEESATASDGERVTVTLASDVLFAPDEHTLSTKARSVVDRAAASITEQADGGEVRVTGHTDDVDSDEYNQKLSERRARTVADRLAAALGPDHTLAEEGRGETEPVAEGTSDAARAANRRVEIEFRGRLVVGDSGTAASGSEVPDTEAPTAVDGPVTIETEAGEYRIEATSMIRRPGAIVGTLTATRTRGDIVDAGWFLPAPLTTVGGREFGIVAGIAGAHNLSLLGDDERILPFDYDTSAGDDVPVLRLLGEEIAPALDDGNSVNITVVWPDNGQDTVTVDGPDTFRISDIPVTDTTGT